MDRSPLNLLAGLWAARIVEGYGARARPEMSEGARAVLLDHLTRRLGSAIAVTPVGDWPDAANAALDAWERGGSVCLNSELGLDEWISCRVQAATGCGSLSK